MRSKQFWITRQNQPQTGVFPVSSIVPHADATRPGVSGPASPSQPVYSPSSRASRAQSVIFSILRVVLPIASQVLGVFMGYCGAHLLFHHRHRFVRLRASCSIVFCLLVFSYSHLPFPFLASIPKKNYIPSPPIAIISFILLRQVP